MWTLILIAHHISNPKDIPARLTMDFETQQQCEASLVSMKYWIKFENFKVSGKCTKSLS